MTLWRWVLALLAAANAAVIVALWLAGTGEDADAGGALAEIARLCGLLGAYLALVTLLLLARIPLLDRLTGFDRLTVWHRRTGVACLVLVLTHAVLITVGYAVADGITVPAELERLITGYPGVITAIAGLACLVAVVVTSVAIVRWRLRYETWYFVHLYAYLGSRSRSATSSRRARVRGPAGSPAPTGTACTSRRSG